MVRVKLQLLKIGFTVANVVPADDVDTQRKR